MAPASPTVAGWELALRLRERRAQLGMEVETVTSALGFTRNYWSAVEHERRILAADKLAALLDLFEFDEDEQQELMQLREATRVRGWWARFAGLLTDELQRYFGLEHGAQGVRTYESLIMPGLLQTGDYARALISTDIAVRKVEVDQRVEVRMQRQERLLGQNPLHLTVILSQAALMQQVGGSTVLRDQLHHLAAMIENHPTTIEVRVIPFSATTCGLLGAATFHLVDFESPRLPTLAWQETVTSAGIVDDPVQTRDLSLTYGDALRYTLDAEDSLSLIRRRIKELT